MEVIDPKQIRKLMVIQGVSQRSLAAYCGYASHTYLGRVLRGDLKTVTTETAALIASCFGVGIDDLFVVRVSSNARQNVQGDAA